MNTPKVSVIIPVYKAENFIEKCCRSLFEQTLDDLEYIFVNDCTPDNSIEILKKTLDEYPKRIEQVKVLNQKTNQGVRNARSWGQETAIGEYIIHCDSDDYVDVDMYKTMYNAGIVQNADVVCCNYFNEYKDHKVLREFPYLIETRKNLILGISPIFGSLCNKLVRKSLLDEHQLILYDDINMGEDLGLATRYRFFSKKTIIIPRPFYHYTVFNENSISTTFNSKKSDDIILCAKKLDFFFKEQNADDEFHFQILYLKFQAMQQYLINPYIRDIKKWKTIFPETSNYIWKFKDSPFNIRLIAWCASINMDWIAKSLLYMKDKRFIVPKK